MRFGFLISLIIALIITIFAILNAAIIPINFIVVKANVSLAIVIIISLIAGAVIVTLMGIKREMKLKKENKNFLKRLDELQKENDLLREIKNSNASASVEDKSTTT
jgi:uncharacterized integral membrane protein